MPENSARIHVREATREDIPDIVMVSSSSMKEGEDVGFCGPGPDDPFRDVEKLSASWVEPNLVGSEELYVAEVDGRVLGLVAIERRTSEFELVDIDVTGDCQGRGIGTNLVRFVEMKARDSGVRAVTLGTSRNAEGVPWKSLPWWLARGYEITHEEENAWTRSIGPGAREIRMRKDLE
jgi:GNAT superfamily N-acetyltransferase